MTKTIIGLFDDFTAAERALRDLAEVGFSGDDISLVAKDPKSDEVRTTNADKGEASEGA